MDGYLYCPRRPPSLTRKPAVRDPTRGQMEVRDLTRGQMEVDALTNGEGQKKGCSRQQLVSRFLSDLHGILLLFSFTSPVKKNRPKLTRFMSKISVD